MGVRRLLVAAAIAGALTATFPALASADSWVGFGSGSMFTGSYFTSAFDCNGATNQWWNDIKFTKSTTAKGTIAWLEQSGTWRYSVVDSYEVTMWYTIPSILWIKKLLAKNSSSVVYSGSAYGWKQTTSTWCA
jgi:hypothetical protein